MSLDLQLLRVDGELILQARGQLLDVRLVGAERACATPVREVETVFDLLKCMLGQVDGLEVTSLIDIMQGDVKGDKSVEVEFLKLIHSLLDGVDDTCDAFLLAIERT